MYLLALKTLIKTLSNIVKLFLEASSKLHRGCLKYIWGALDLLLCPDNRAAERPITSQVHRTGTCSALGAIQTMSAHTANPDLSRLAFPISILAPRLLCSSSCPCSPEWVQMGVSLLGSSPWHCQWAYVTENGCTRLQSV